MEDIDVTAPMVPFLENSKEKLNFLSNFRPKCDYSNICPRILGGGWQKSILPPLLGGVH